MKERHVQNCVKQTSYLIVKNGMPSSKIETRQGCLLSQLPSDTALQDLAKAAGQNEK